jgi:hypothetical protein
MAKVQKCWLVPHHRKVRGFGETPHLRKKDGFPVPGAIALLGWKLELANLCDLLEPLRHVS